MLFQCPKIRWSILHWASLDVRWNLLKFFASVGGQISDLLFVVVFVDVVLCWETIRFLAKMIEYSQLSRQAFNPILVVCLYRPSAAQAQIEQIELQDYIIRPCTKMGQ